MFGLYSISYRIVTPEEKKYTPVTWCSFFKTRDNANPNTGHIARILLRSPPLEMK
jgi:hypothetical protein